MPRLHQGERVAWANFSVVLCDFVGTKALAEKVMSSLVVQRR